jgi:hypothetical protein
MKVDEIRLLLQPGEKLLFGNLPKEAPPAAYMDKVIAHLATDWGSLLTQHLLTR